LNAFATPNSSSFPVPTGRPHFVELAYDDHGGVEVDIILHKHPSSLQTITMSPSISGSVSSFFLSLVGIFFHLFNSVLAVFQAIFALGMDVVQSTLTVVKHLVMMVRGVFQGVLGFIIGNESLALSEWRCA
jgi:hypothetical protein